MCLSAICVSFLVKCLFKELTRLYGFKMCQIIHISIPDFSPELQIYMQRPPGTFVEVPDGGLLSMFKTKSAIPPPVLGFPNGRGNAWRIYYYVPNTVLSAFFTCFN